MHNDLNSQMQVSVYVSSGAGVSVASCWPLTDCIAQHNKSTGTAVTAILGLVFVFMLAGRTLV